MENIKDFIKEVTKDRAERRRIAISNQGQFVRRTSSVLLVFSLIIFLLPGIAIAQDQTDNINQRAQLAMDAFKAYTSEGQNARMGAHAAAARIKANNGNDPEMISYIASYYDNRNPGDPGYWPSLSSVAWVVAKYRDKFTPAQLDNLKTRVKGLSNLVSAGTENHTLNYQVGGYLFAQLWPNETGWHGGRTSEQLMSQTRTNLLNIMRSLYSKGYNEDLSTTYTATHLSPYYILYDCATDPQVKSAADAAITFLVSHLAANHFEGVVVPPFNRQNAPQFNKHNGGSWNPVLQWIYWLYWGEVQNRNPTTSTFRTNQENRWFIHAALSDWRPSDAINSLAFGQTVPYELTSTKCNFEHYGAGGPGECERYVYRDNLYAMGSGNMRFRPNGYHLDYNMFGLIYKSGDTYNYIDCHHDYWRSNHRIWTGASPFIQMAQHKSTAILLFNIPANDPWYDRGSYLNLRDNHFNSLIQEGLVRYPKSVDESVEANGWIFLREGDVYIAIRPLKAYTIDPNYYTLMTKPGDHLNHFVDAVAQFNVVRSAFGQTGFIFDVATKEEFATFAAFQTEVSSKPVTVDWDNFSVTYMNLRGNTLTSTWRAPEPDYKDVPPSYNDNVNAQVWVRPTFKVDGTTVTIDSDFTGGNAVMKSPSIELVSRMLRLQTPAGQLVADWRGEYANIGSHYYAAQIEFLDSVSGKPVEGLEVILHGEKYITDSQGMVSPPELLEGIYRLTIADKRFLFTENPLFEIRSDSLLRIQVKRMPHLTLKVINRTSGAPVNRAVVKTEGKTYLSNASGFVDMGTWTLGTFIASVEHRDYFTVSETLVVPGDTTILVPLTPIRANVAFSFSDMNGPVSTVKVTLSGSQFTSSTWNGFFSLLPARENYSWSAEKMGYYTLQDNFFLDTDTTLQITMELATSVQKKTGDTRYLVYPNPAANYLIIDRDIPLANPIKIDLVNVSGISVYAAQNVTLPYTLRLEGMNPGIYFLKIHSPEGFANQIIIVK